MFYQYCKTKTCDLHVSNSNNVNLLSLLAIGASSMLNLKHSKVKYHIIFCFSLDFHIPSHMHYNWVRSLLTWHSFNDKLIKNIAILCNKILPSILKLCLNKMRYQPMYKHNPSECISRNKCFIFSHFVYFCLFFLFIYTLLDTWVVQEKFNH